MTEVAGTSGPLGQILSSKKKHTLLWKNISCAFGALASVRIRGS